MEDPISHLRELIPLLDHYWDRAPSAQRTVKLASVAGRLKQVREMVRDEVDLCMEKSKHF